jgi:hypothetical protein
MYISGFLKIYYKFSAHFVIIRKIAELLMENLFALSWLQVKGIT